MRRWSPGEKTVELLLREGTHQMTSNIELPRDLRKIQAELNAKNRARKKPNRFLTNLTRRLTVLAPGSALRPQDEGLVRELRDGLQASGNRADALIEGIVLSDAFRRQGKETL